MCYSVAFSTTCPDDLTQNEGPHYYIVALPEFGRDSENLAYPRKWYLGCRYGGCSCHFWHEWRTEQQPNFGPHEDWMPEEDEEDMDSTAAFYDFVAGLVNRGFKVDVVDMLDDMMPQYVRTVEISISQLPRERFRFYDGWRFDLKA